MTSAMPSGPPKPTISSASYGSANGPHTFTNSQNSVGSIHPRNERPGHLKERVRHCRASDHPPAAPRRANLPMRCRGSRRVLCRVDPLSARTKPADFLVPRGLWVLRSLLCQKLSETAHLYTYTHALSTFRSTTQKFSKLVSACRAQIASESKGGAWLFPGWTTRRCG